MSFGIFSLDLALFLIAASALTILFSISERSKKFSLLVGLGAFMFLRSAILQLTTGSLQHSSNLSSAISTSTTAFAGQVAFGVSVALLLCPLVRFFPLRIAGTSMPVDKSKLRSIGAILIALLSASESESQSHLNLLFFTGLIAVILFVPMPNLRGPSGPRNYRIWNRTSQLVPIILVFVVLALGGLSSDVLFERARSAAPQPVRPVAKISVERELDPRRIAELRPLAESAFHFSESPAWTMVPELFHDGLIPHEFQFNPSTEKASLNLHLINIEQDNGNFVFDSQGHPISSAHPAVIHVKPSDSPVALLIFGASHILPIFDIQAGAKVESIYLFVNEDDPRDVADANVSIDKNPRSEVDNFNFRQPGINWQLRSGRTRQAIMRKEFSSVRKDSLLSGVSKVPVFILHGYAGQGTTHDRNLSVSDDNLKALLNGPEELFKGMHWASTTSVMNGGTINVPCYTDLAKVQDVAILERLIYHEHEVKDLSGFTRVDENFQVSYVGRIEGEVPKMLVPDQVNSAVFFAPSELKYYLTDTYNFQTRGREVQFYSMKMGSFDRVKLEVPTDVADQMRLGLRLFGYNNLTDQLVVRYGNETYYNYDLKTQKWISVSENLPAGIRSLVPSPATHQLFGLTDSKILNLDERLHVLSEIDLQAANVHKGAFSFEASSVLGDKIVAVGVQNNPDSNETGRFPRMGRFSGSAELNKTF